MLFLTVFLYNIMSMLIYRSYLQQVTAETTVPTDGYLSCDEAHDFWVSWAGGVISVGRGLEVTVDEFMSHTRTTGFPIKHFMISSFVEYSAVWHFNPCPIAPGIFSLAYGWLMHYNSHIYHFSHVLIHVRKSGIYGVCNYHIIC